MPILYRDDIDEFCNELVEEMDEESVSCEELLMGLAKAIEQRKKDEEDEEPEDLAAIYKIGHKALKMDATLVELGEDASAGKSCAYDDVPTRLSVYMNRKEARSLITRLKSELERDHDDDLLTIHIGLEASFRKTAGDHLGEDGHRYREEYCLNKAITDVIVDTRYSNHGCCCKCSDSVDCPEPENRNDENWKQRVFKSDMKLYGCSP